MMDITPPRRNLRSSMTRALRHVKRNIDDYHKMKHFANILLGVSVVCLVFAIVFMNAFNEDWATIVSAVFFAVSALALVLLVMVLPKTMRRASNPTYVTRLFP
jgi:membrane protein YdbS with pleckstrin-like domain